jgi:leucyl aminopeptidase (aminopeptidase T)
MVIKKILSADSKARYAAEFGIGTNEKAKIIYNILQDEKVIGTCHIAFGTNINFHGRNKSKVHIDLMLLKPTIKIDGKIIMKNGEPLW